ncbi:hypothetical protein BHE90_002530 [Fusarium euwallaceae]|uniref:Uncharacterized protein n=2 Tax=Fusarium solani species complex TaxID=232080 RepID=A0A430M4W1_9HYPO|nr:hypothetical protein CEP51_000190 [Fusarium floridanum]RTE82914.1 hypothetical protein BHE90_002530 [Fusarium euwallaceae]
MAITRVARVALRRQATATTILSRTIPAHARYSSSFLDFFNNRRVVGEEVKKPTRTKETKTRGIWTKEAEPETTDAEATETKTFDTQATETQPVKKPPFDTVPVETPSIENQLDKDKPIDDQLVEEESKIKFKEKPKGRSKGRVDQSKQKNVQNTTRHGPKWIHELNKRIKALQDRQHIRKDIPPTVWKEISKLNSSINQNWSRVFASREGFLTPKEGVAGLTKQEVAWGDMDSMGRFPLPRQSHGPSNCETGHVNSVVYNKYAEACRVHFIRGLSEYRIDNTEEEKKQYLQLMTPESVGLVLRSIRTYFKHPVKFPDRVSVFHKILKPPDAVSDHFLLEVLILSEYNYKIAARLAEDVAIWDFEREQNTTLKPNQVRDLNRIYKRQPLNREAADKEIDEWMRKLANIEMRLQNNVGQKIERRRLEDIPLKERMVESAIDDALRATGELEPGFEDSKDVEALKEWEALKGTQDSKDAEAPSDAAVLEGAKDAASESTKEAKKFSFFKF